jgi:hypothetical protein
MPGQTVRRTGSMNLGGPTWATGEEMKVVLVFVLALVSLAMVATTLAYDHTTVTAGVTAAAQQAVAGASEPAAMLLSGSALIGLAGAVKRLTF